VNALVRSALFPLIVVAALIWLAVQTFQSDSGGSSTSLRFSDALQLARQNPNGIDHVTFHPSTQKVDFKLVGAETRSTVYPVDQSGYELQQLLEKGGVAFDAKRKGSSAAWTLLTGVLPFVLLFGFWIVLTRTVRQKPITEQAPPETPSHY
jgi:ATP-dependent Zn protease